MSRLQEIDRTSNGKKGLSRVTDHTLSDGFKMQCNIT